MDPAFLLLLVFLVYSVLLGVCLARMRAINRELDLMKGVITTLGNVQRDMDCEREVESTRPVEITPELLKRLSMALEGDNG
jgi:hypothetical protein